MTTTKYNKEFNKQNMKTLRVELESLLESFSDRGIHLELGNASFGGSECSFKLNVNIVGQLTREQKAVELFTDFKYGDMVRDRRTNTIYKLVGYKTRSPKKPLIIADLEGTEYKATDSFLTNVEHLVEEDDYESEDQTDSPYYQSQEDYYNL